MSVPKQFLDELTCKPLDTYEEILMFLENPPPWRSLCKELTPHSELKIQNTEINKHSKINISEPETFCHFNPDAEDPVRVDGRKLPKTLLCHDMANGYHDDSYIDGTETHNAYTFYNWSGIDIFCYFSHHFITIPPLSWINVGHAHGVKVIGTVITEWRVGVDIWNKVLESETTSQNFASALVAITKILKFDGWLLNVENKIAKPDDLLEFVRYFNRLLHDEIPHAELIWYDSVTITGNLNWQNKLNEKNRAFFDACDGLFTNYSWTEFDIVTSAIEAGDRLTDLYIGVDVWGRNFYGGGKFNTQEAIKVVHEQGCSIAIFAPAWTHEAMSEDNNEVVMGDHLDKYGQFQLRDRALWGSFWPFLNTGLPCTLPFKTSFCRGQGIKRRLYGEVICPSPWYNLRHQQYQPNSSHGSHGYMLSSDDVILAVSRLSMIKSSKGIIRYRESFQAARYHLLSTKPDGTEEYKDSHTTLSDEEGKSEDEKGEEQIKKRESEPHKEEEAKHKMEEAVQRKEEEQKKAAAAAAAAASIVAEPGTHKRTLKDVIKRLFGFKPKVDVNVIEREHVPKAGTSTQDAKAESSANKATEESTEQDTNIERSDKDANPRRSVQDETSADPSPRTSMISTGMSMLTMSLNLDLGQNKKFHRIALAAVAAERECLELYYQDSFTGGACLRVHPADAICHEHRTTRLFHCDFRCRNTLIVCIVTKCVEEYPNQYLNVKLFMKNSEGLDTRMVLVGRNVPQVEHSRLVSEGGTFSVSPLDRTEQRFKDIQKYLLLNEAGFYVPVENFFGWTVRYYEVDVPGSQVTSVNVKTGQDRGPVLLGHFGICQKNPESKSPINTADWLPLTI